MILALFALIKISICVNFFNTGFYFDAPLEKEYRRAQSRDGNSLYNFLSDLGRNGVTLGNRAKVMYYTITGNTKSARIIEETLKHPRLKLKQQHSQSKHHPLLGEDPPPVSDPDQPVPDPDQPVSDPNLPKCGENEVYLNLLMAYLNVRLILVLFACVTLECIIL
jgi:hypothetical protein